jgi:hypothetical protein
MPTMRKLTLLILFGIFFGCSPKIKSIIEFSKFNGEFKPSKLIEFDRNGNRIRIENLGNSRSNRIVTTEFQNNRRVSEKSCDYFKSHDTCVIRSFSKYEVDLKLGIEKQTLYEADSAVRFIREIENLKNLKITKTYTWGFFPTRNPNIEDALILIDTTYLDKKGRKIKSLHYNSTIEKPWTEIFKYKKNEYSIETIGTARDTMIVYELTDLQRKANKNNVDYNFLDLENFKYEITKY